MTINPRLSLIDASSQFYQLGWMVGTAGNLSARLPDGSFWITASGKSKGKLRESDFVRLTVAGEILDSGHPDNRPSAETSIHMAIYGLFPGAQACYHVHSIEANLVSNLAEGDSLPLPPLEMIKGFGVWEENPSVSIPVFKNYINVPQIGEDIRQRLSVTPPDVPALLIVNHGVTVWGDSIEATQRHLELAEYIFRYMVTAEKILGGRKWR
ncbi:MAG: Methylthioribulose-1-phosphate dehydratase [Chroococcopsis gigantea SAG 12.99]|jgi:methylthioribulose-1-phosphate dehydratase|nr:methylthioribulose 1-phosphate dehydratase [Chlorogloea purpurea SAG 13.99]MDV2999342.1 Methylthioribulose-1-phosphate dehydratase [Chroococcopsis gigantea SAG 12.99]